MIAILWRVLNHVPLRIILSTSTNEERKYSDIIMWYNYRPMSRIQVSLYILQWLFEKSKDWLVFDSTGNNYITYVLTKTLFNYCSLGDKRKFGTLFILSKIAVKEQTSRESKVLETNFPVQSCYNCTAFLFNTDSFVLVFELLINTFGYLGTWRTWKKMYKMKQTEGIRRSNWKRRFVNWKRTKKC